MKLNFPNEFKTRTLGQLRDSRQNYFSNRNPYDITLFDEVNPMEVKDVLDKMLMSDATKIDFVLGLYT